MLCVLAFAEINFHQLYSKSWSVGMLSECFVLVLSKSSKDLL